MASVSVCWYVCVCVCVYVRACAHAVYTTAFKNPASIPGGIIYPYILCCKMVYWLLNKFETCQLLVYYYFLFTDESVDVERQSHAIIALVEELVGESVQQYF